MTYWRDQSGTLDGTTVTTMRRTVWFFLGFFFLYLWRTVLARDNYALIFWTKDLFYNNCMTTLFKPIRFHSTQSHVEIEEDLELRMFMGTWSWSVYHDCSECSRRNNVLGLAFPDRIPWDCRNLGAARTRTALHTFAVVCGILLLSVC